jgi:hypothetical protein
MSTIVAGETAKCTIWVCARADGDITVTGKFGEAGYRSQYLSHAKRALYHLSYIPSHTYAHTHIHKCTHSTITNTLTHTNTIHATTINTAKQTRRNDFLKHTHKDETKPSINDFVNIHC